ncbi:YafY family protein [Telmatospirillum sp. J64-1]|uniref:helix-turn-helix transcriptional regulator n=1 Tax=Telmatospirillum sp. J64-1 TaxID=2502183 RepID=UPI00115E7A65|nr:YafY family protein [Telmatospirillum sp. J64-1]
MRRADRLFEIVQVLRRRRIVKASQLAESLEVSERTIYRDIRDLQANGVPIDGEAGVGYMLRPGFDIPPIMFSRDEIEALVVGARMVQAWGGATLALAATKALERVEAVLPEQRRPELEAARLFVPDYGIAPDLAERIDKLRQAVNLRQVIAFDYERADGTPSHRHARPLGMHYWGRVWTLAAWCEFRASYRTFRVDRIGVLHCLDRYFLETPECSLSGYLVHAACNEERGRAAD